MNSTLKRCGIYASLVTVTALATLLAVRARAAGIPDADVLTYTGYLEDADGRPLQSTVSVAVELWTGAEAGAGKKVCEAVAETVELQAGRFQVPLIDCDAEVKKNPNLWTEVRVDGASLGRTKLGAVPYAIEAAHATSADEAAEAQRAVSADNATTAKHATTVELVTEAMLAADDDGQGWVTGCLQAGGNAALACSLAADRTCMNRGHAGGFYVGETDGTFRSIKCFRK
jgi:hypothetical protein